MTLLELQLDTHKFLVEVDIRGVFVFVGGFSGAEHLRELVDKMEESMEAKWKERKNNSDLQQVVYPKR